jgi:mannosyl-3-phosphoglycerate phosphatase
MINSTQTQPIIFTDLDGSLLDHFDYSFSAAEPLLRQLEELQIPVVPVTSKTAAEVVQLRQQLNNPHPFIVENGAAIFIPKGYFPEQPQEYDELGDFWVRRNSKSRAHWLAILAQHAKQFHGEFETFSSVVELRGIKGLQALTELSAQGAQLSQQREYSEPIHWLGTKERKLEFIQTITKAGGTLLQGGRFLCLSDNVNKGIALLQLQSVYNKYSGASDIKSLAIGDSNNDIHMLEAASCALIIRSKNHGVPLVSKTTEQMVSQAFGAQGWAEGVTLWLKKLHR